MRWISSTLAVVVAAGSWTAAQAPAAPAAPQPRFVVVLDAAHGGDDAGGCLANGQLEKTLTLAMSVRLRSLLAARGIQVLTIREQDTTIDLNRRAEIANHANAQACLILHASESGSGVHLFVSSIAPAPPVRLAAWKTAQAAWVTRSLALAGVLNSALLHAGSTVTLSRSSMPGVESMACPSVAVEMAPERDAALKTAAELDNADYQARVAGALAAAILEWRTEAREP
jgi:N-acetylmuramoyl-L-alanine amidase